MGTDVQSARLTATGAATTRRSRVRGVVLTGTAGAGTLELRDGGAGGAPLLTLDVLANASLDIGIPGNGVLFDKDVYATLTGLTSAVIFYD